MAEAGVVTFLVFAGIAALFGVGSIVANRMLGAKRRRSYLGATTYECGEEAEGEAQIDFPTQHYVFAIVFVAVDVIGFILALWGLSFRPSLVGNNFTWTPTLIAFGFTALALAGIYYALHGERRWVV
ncbi:MAG: NADH-quinone oxidoreductase subunit A [Thermoplasmata archaeon]|nr:NADH-quinone oxidoreductase subunit A [Thermoplasmata archaeon]